MPRYNQRALNWHESSRIFNPNDELYSTRHARLFSDKVRLVQKGDTNFQHKKHRRKSNEH